MSRKSSWVLGALAIGLAAMQANCAEERDPINRVQANAMHKSFFVGADLAAREDDPEFYSAVTVVDVPFGADQAGVFTGLVGSLRRIKWEITEQTLNARLAYEFIDGVDGHGVSRTDNDGIILASWPIESHFDIRHAYNPSTGEELNVVEENSSDRPWNEREYFRVDWGTNLIVTSRMWDPLGGADYDVEPLAYYVNDPNNPDHPVFEVEDGYFDITNKVHLTPKMIDLGSGPMPACFYRGSIVLGATYPWGNCDNSEITARYSFKRVRVEGEAGFTDYQPVEWDGSKMRSFGAFVQQRLGWDRNYGIVDSEWHYFAQRYNIWEKSHNDKACATPETTPYGCNPSRDGDVDCNNKVEPEKGELADGTQDECDDGQNFGSKCDKLVGKCTIPYSKRTPKAVAWHYNVGLDDQVMFDSTEEATWQWDAAMRMAVQAARYTECVRTGTKSLTGSPWEKYKTDGADLAQTRTTCGALFPIDQSYDESEQDAVREVNICRKNGTEGCVEKVVAQNPQYLELQRGADPAYNLESYSVAGMQPMVVLCHNPVGATDNAACGEPGTVTRPGDIRYHQVNVWPTRQTLSPWGYGPSLGDPLTGEIISAGINVYNSVTDNAAQTFMDQIRWINGEISSKDITDGEHVFDWVRASSYEDMYEAPQMSQEDINQRLSGISGVAPEKFAATPPAGLNALPAMQELEKTVVPPGVIPEDRSEFEERISRAKETGVESDLINPMWLQMAAVDPDLPWEEQLQLASPLRTLDSRSMLNAYEQTQKLLAQQGQCILGAPEPTSIPAVAKIMKTKFPYDGNATAEQNHARWEKMWNYLRFKLNFNVILHEMGHTVSLRHNFVSSWDKYNYKTQYWQLRTDSGRVTAQCNGPQADGANCIGPRYFDPLTQDEVDNGIWTWQQTTVMDYAGDITQDMLGLGVYDLAATRMFYADAVDVRADTVVTDPMGEAVQAIVDYPGYLVDQVATFSQMGVDHYTQYNELFKLVQPERCTAVTPTAPDWWDAERWGVWDPVYDGRIVHNERCRRPPVDYVQWDDLIPDQITVAFEDPEFFTPRRPKDLYDRPRVPYGFLSDEYADGWSPSAFRHDNGADAYEEMVFHTNLYENRHIYDNYRNGRVNFTVYGAYQRALSRYHAKIENLTQGMAYIVGYYLRDWALNEGVPFDQVVAANIGPGSWLYNQAITAGIGFDHFVRVMTRPHTGAHSCPSGGTASCNPNSDRVLHPLEDVNANGLPAGTALAGYMPNGIFVAGDSLAYAGRPIDNNFQYSHGYWTFNYLNQAGSYYEKTYAAQAMLNATYGAINFFRLDGVDARFRHVNFGDLFPDGMRRFIGVALMEDQQLLGPRISADGTGQPNFALSPYMDADDENPEQVEYPVDPMAWVSYIPKAGPVACAPVDDVLACVNTLGTPIRNGAPVENTAWVVDPQLGYEVQKFIVFWYYVYQPGKQNFDWVELMRIYKLGSDLDPDYLPDQFVEWRDPESGHRYIAKTYGDETIFGKTYDKGIAAKMIQWANHLTEEAYELDPVTPFDPITGRANVVFDTEGKPVYKNGGTSCDDSKPCFQLRRYRGLIDFTRDTAAHLGFPEPALQIFSPPD